MKIGTLVAGLLLAGMGTPVLAQSVPEDIRCLAISSLFSKSATEPAARASATQSLLFYLGRLDGRTDAATITSTLRTLNRSIDPKAAPAEMSACAARMVHAQQVIVAASRAAAPGNAPRK